MLNVFVFKEIMLITLQIVKLVIKHVLHVQDLIPIIVSHAIQLHLDNLIQLVKRAIAFLDILVLTQMNCAVLAVILVKHALYLQPPVLHVMPQIIEKLLVLLVYVRLNIMIILQIKCVVLVIIHAQLVYLRLLCNAILAMLLSLETLKTQQPNCVIVK